MGVNIKTIITIAMQVKFINLTGFYHKCEIPHHASK